MPAGISPATRHRPATILPALVLLLASLIQWPAAPSAPAAGTAGMTAPVPLAWEAGKPLAAGGDSANGRFRLGSPLVRSLDLGRDRRLAPLLRGTTLVVGEGWDRLLLWGRLLL